jgi:hypothetical protein
VTARRAVTMTVACSLAALGACTDRELTEPDPVPVNQARLEAATVAGPDLTEGFSPRDDAGGIADPVVPDHPCDDEIEDLLPRDEASSAASDGAYVLESVVAWFPAQGGAVPDAFRRVRDECSAVSEVGATTSIRADDLDFGPLSDNVLSLLFEVEQTGQGITETGVVVIRRGDLVGVLRLRGPRPISRELLDTATRTAIGRLTLLQQQTGQ